MLGMRSIRTMGKGETTVECKTVVGGMDGIFGVELTYLEGEVWCFEG